MSAGLRGIARAALGSTRVITATKMTLVSAAAYAVATAVVRAPAPAAALVPLFVFRTPDPWIVWRGIIGRLLGVILGVGVATFILAFSQASWWWVGIIVMFCACVQAIPKVGNFLVDNWQVAISAILVLAVGPGPYGGERLVESLIGTSITVIVGVFIWPPDASDELTRRVDKVAADLTTDLRGLETLIAADPASVRSIEDSVLQHLVAARGTMEDVPKAHRSLRSSVYRWSSARLRTIDEQAARLAWLTEEAHALSALVYRMAALNADAQPTRPSPEDRAGLRDGCEVVAQAVLDPAARPDVQGRLDGILERTGADPDPWTRAFVVALRDLAGTMPGAMAADKATPGRRD